MTALLYLMPAALLLGLLGLVAFLWALKSGQFEDLDGAAQRILIDEEDAALPPSRVSPPKNRRRPAG
jgi:cbb3-type cytochrome oxidase maturation protein